METKIKTISEEQSSPQERIIPEGYKPVLGYKETQKAIKLVKETFAKKLCEKLSLIEIEAPRFLLSGTGIQDDLAGTQEPVKFRTKFRTEFLEIPQSLAKWKRYTLGKHSFKQGTGICTMMAAVRKDEDVSQIHSVYVDQWDWEKVVGKEQRTLDYLKETVREIYSAIFETSEIVGKTLPKEITFVHSEELEKTYPDLTPREREKEITKKAGAVFVIGIGHPLESGEPHDVRAADYDDWTTQTTETTKGLNGDIIIWDDVREDALEISSMGIRVDSEALEKQLEHLKQPKLSFHKAILEGKLPFSIGGGIGQSRLCMLLLKKAHIGEVQSSIWPERVEQEFKAKEIPLL